jgi:predicted Fe-Mo cluster-binding NifX family protein
MELADLPKIGAPALRALQSAGIDSLEGLTQVTEAELSRLHGIGPNALGKLRQALAERGLSFREFKS